MSLSSWFSCYYSIYLATTITFYYLLSSFSSFNLFIISSYFVFSRSIYLYFSFFARSYKLFYIALYSSSIIPFNKDGSSFIKINYPIFSNKNVILINGKLLYGLSNYIYSINNIGDGTSSEIFFELVDLYSSNWTISSILKGIVL